MEFEEGLDGGGTQRPESGTRFELLTIEDVCQELGIGKSWVYKRLKSAKIPSVKLSHNIKVKREDLERYLENNCYRPSGQEGNRQLSSIAIGSEHTLYKAFHNACFLFSGVALLFVSRDTYLLRKVMHLRDEGEYG